MSIDNYLKQAERLNHVTKRSQEWLDEHPEIRLGLDKALMGFNELPFAIPIFGGPEGKTNDIHPWHHLFYEAEQDLDSAVLLLLMGFYKDGLKSLRSFLELQIFALYNFVNEDHNNFQNWLDGKTNTPRVSELLQVLSTKSTDFQKLNDILSWDKEIVSLYKELSRFMHTQGALHTHTALRNSNQTTFSETGIETGTAFLLRAIRLGGIGFSVNFPMSFQPLPLFEKFAFNQPAGGFLAEDQVERVKAIFSDDVARELSAMCLSNPDASSLAEGVRELPDLSEEEIFKSLKDTLESEEFANSKEDILQMIKKGEIGKAFSYVQAIQRAMMRTMTMVLYNPFYRTSNTVVDN